MVRNNPSEITARHCVSTSLRVHFCIMYTYTRSQNNALSFGLGSVDLHDLYCDCELVHT